MRLCPNLCVLERERETKREWESERNRERDRKNMIDLLPNFGCYQMNVIIMVCTSTPANDYSLFFSIYSLMVLLLRICKPELVPQLTLDRQTFDITNPGRTTVTHNKH